MQIIKIRNGGTTTKTKQERETSIGGETQKKKNAKEIQQQLVEIFHKTAFAPIQYDRPAIVMQ